MFLKTAQVHSKTPIFYIIIYLILKTKTAFKNESRFFLSLVNIIVLRL
ncbi:hypothetical protein SAMN05444671_2960 [Flavobacterium sp. CF108]|nr:hypothetical protein [Flavobacterium sp. 2755]SEP14287.1 hypothetical protein SAMN04487978_4578 [Flavobacterium sp. fv08]SHH49553.1 hypothetical protein SAMN05444671_2960 [Flavobacterium sp. CF108]